MGGSGGQGVSEGKNSPLLPTLLLSRHGFKAVGFWPRGIFAKDSLLSEASVNCNSLK